MGCYHMKNKIPSDHYLTDSEHGTSDTSKPSSPAAKPILLHEEFNIADPIEFYNNLGAAIIAAEEKDKANTKLERAKNFFNKQDPKKRFDLMKIILLASILVKQSLIENTFLPPNFPDPATVERKLAALWSDVVDGVNGKRYRKPVKETPEPTYAEATYEVLSTLGILTKLAAEVGFGYMTKKASVAMSKVNKSVSGLYGSLFSTRDSSSSASSANQASSQEEHSSSWHVVPPGGEPISPINTQR